MRETNTGATAAVAVAITRGAAALIALFVGLSVANGCIVCLSFRDHEPMRFEVEGLEVIGWEEYAHAYGAKPTHEMAQREVATTSLLRIMAG